VTAHPEGWDRLVRALQQTATVLTHRKPTQRHRQGEMLEGLSGSSGRGMHGEKRRERGRPSRFLVRQISRTRPQEGGLRTERESDPPRVLGERESRLRGEGADGVTESAQETSTGHVGLEHRGHPHCRGERRKLHVTRHTDVATCVGFSVSSSSLGAGGGCTRVPHQA